jgi:hypothetical protein
MKCHQEIWHYGIIFPLTGGNRTVSCTNLGHTGSSGTYKLSGCPLKPANIMTTAHQSAK